MRWMSLFLGIHVNMSLGKRACVKLATLLESLPKLNLSRAACNRTSAPNEKLTKHSQLDKVEQHLGAMHSQEVQG